MGLVRSARLVSLAFVASVLPALLLLPGACGGDEFGAAPATGGGGGTGGAGAASGAGTGGAAGLDASTHDATVESGSKGGSAGAGGDDCAAAILQSDPENCGTCHHSCLGGSCANGVCQPLILFQNDQHPEAGGIGTLGRLQLVHGAKSLLVWVDVGDLGAPGATGMVWSMLSDGTSLKALAPAGTTEPNYLAIGAAKVYWTGSEGTVYDNNIAGGPPVMLVSNLQPGAVRGIATAGNDVWFAEGQTIKHVNVLNLGVTDIVLTTGGPADLVVSDGALYFVDSTNGGVGRVENGQPTLLAHGQSSPRGLFAEPGVDGSLYWLDGAGAVWKVRKSGGGEAQQLTVPATSADANPQNVTADDEYVYWTSWGTCVNSAGCPNGAGGTDMIRGRVQRVRKDGTGLQVLYDGFALPTGIAVDDEAVYWTTWWFTVLQKLAK